MNANPVPSSPPSPPLTCSVCRFTGPPRNVDGVLPRFQCDRCGTWQDIPVADDPVDSTSPATPVLTPPEGRTPPPSPTPETPPTASTGGAEGKATPKAAVDAPDLLAAAVDYASRGFPVLPLWWIEFIEKDGVLVGVCACPGPTPAKPEPCKPGKHPIGELVPAPNGGVLKATTDAKTIRRWWKRFPNANVGIRMGTISKAFAIDVDGSEGEKSIKAFDLPDTVEQRSGRLDGGRHLLFAYPPGAGILNAEGTLPGVDVRGESGYIVAAPSMHQSGRRYAFTENQALGDVPIAACPADLLARIAGPKAESAKRKTFADLDKGGPIPIGMRRPYVMHVLGKMRHNGATFDDLLVRARQISERFVSAPKDVITDKHLVGMAQNVCKYPTGEENRTAPEDTRVDDSPDPTDKDNTGSRSAKKSAATKGDSSLPTISAREILSTDYPEPRWIVPTLLPEGLAILFGRPKIGKSWLALTLALAAVFGGTFLGGYGAIQTGVLYLALEDSPRRIKKRLLALGMATLPDGLDFLFSHPRLDAGAAEALDAWLGEHPGVFLVMIDTLNRVRSPRPKNVDPYQHDAQEIGKLQAVAMRRGVSLVIIHHDRKDGSDDWLDQLSGTLGVAGTADALMFLTRDRGSTSGRLRVTGRDLDVEHDLALEFKGGFWRIVGAGALADLTPERRAIVDACPESGDGFSPTSIKLKTGLSLSTVKSALPDLLRGGFLRRSKRGHYTRGGGVEA